jgi:hypothetical protein
VTFAPEPAHAHGTAPRTAVLLCNLGTPEAPTPAAVRRYLAEFLSDPRVVEIPRSIWLPILHGVVLRVRPARSARRYASIWTPQGSPLKVWTERQATLLEGYLGQRGQRVVVRHAMRYGAPSIGTVLDEAKAAGADRILVVPLYRSTRHRRRQASATRSPHGCAGPATSPRSVLSSTTTTTLATSKRSRSGSTSTGACTGDPTSSRSASTACRGVRSRSAIRTTANA